MKYYVFVGTIRQCSNAAMNHKVVSFTIEIDFDSDVHNAPNYRSFHADYVSGPAFEKDYNIPQGIDKHGYDMAQADPYGAHGSIFCAPNVGDDYGDSRLVLWSTKKMVSQWAVGELVQGHQFGGALNPTIEYDLTLVCVTSLPSTLSPPSGLHVK